MPKRGATRRNTASPEERSKHVLREAETWAEENRALLGICFAEFKQTGEWPTLERLEHRLELAGMTTSAKALAREMPIALGFVEQDRLVLLCRSLLEIEGAETLLDDWFKSIRRAYFGWMKDPGEGFGSEQVAAQVNGDDRRLRQVSALLLRESWIFGSGVGDAKGPWTRKVVSAVRVARDATNARELLDARAAVEWSDPELPSATAPRWLRLWRYVSNNTLLAGLAVIVIVALIGFVAKHVIDSNGSAPRPTRPAQPKRSRTQPTLDQPSQSSTKAPPGSASKPSSLPPHSLRAHLVSDRADSPTQISAAGINIPSGTLEVAINDQSLKIGAQDWNTIVGSSAVRSLIGISIDPQIMADATTRNRLQYLADLIVKRAGSEVSPIAIGSVSQNDSLVTIVAVVNPTSDSYRLSGLTVDISDRLKLTHGSLAHGVFYRGVREGLIVAPSSVFFGELRLPLQRSPSSLGEQRFFQTSFHWNELVSCGQSRC